MIGKLSLRRARAFCRSFSNLSKRPARSPPSTVCFDIFSPQPGTIDVTSHFVFDSSNETKIAPRSVRIAPELLGLLVIKSMVASKVRAATRPCQRIRRYPHPTWKLEGLTVVRPAACEQIRLFLSVTVPIPAAARTTSRLHHWAGRCRRCGGRHAVRGRDARA